jgi:outer membrane biosynthesis protein TonB
MFKFRTAATLLMIASLPVWSQSSPPSVAGSSSDSAQQTETPSASAPLPVSEKDMRHLARKKVQPVSTQSTTNFRGTVVLSLTVDKSGVPMNIKLVSGNPLLSGPSIEAARQWRYKPYLVNGNPVEVETQNTFEYPIPCALPRC